MDRRDRELDAVRKQGTRDTDGCVDAAGEENSADDGKTNAEEYMVMDEATRGMLYPLMLGGFPLCLGASRRNTAGFAFNLPLLPEQTWLTSDHDKIIAV